MNTERIRAVPRADGIGWHCRSLAEAMGRKIVGFGVDTDFVPVVIVEAGDNTEEDCRAAAARLRLETRANPAI